LVHEGGIDWVPRVAQSNPPMKCVRGCPPRGNEKDAVWLDLNVLHRPKYAFAAPTSCSVPGRSASDPSEKLLS